MGDKIILLVEDHPDDQELTLLALKKNKILNEVVVAHEGAEALDYLFASGISHIPQVNFPILVFSRIQVKQDFQLLKPKFCRSDSKKRKCQQQKLLETYRKHISLS